MLLWPDDMSYYRGYVSNMEKLTSSFSSKWERERLLMLVKNAHLELDLDILSYVSMFKVH